MGRGETPVTSTTTDFPPGTPTTAIVRLQQRRGGVGRGEGEAEQTDTVRLSEGGVWRGDGRVHEEAGEEGEGEGLDGEIGLPGSSVLRHRVRRQLFSEESQARPLVFCPFCGEGVFCTGRLTEHLEACFVLDRCRGSDTHTEVEAAIKSISAGGGSVPVTINAFEAPEGLFLAGDGSFQDTVLQDAPSSASFDIDLRRFRPAGSTNSASAIGSVGGGIGSGVIGVDTSAGVGGGGSGGGEISCVPEISFAVSEISSGAVQDEEVVMERCADCGRTFAPGRLASHAKACRSVFMERRRPYDPKVMRAKGTPLEFFQKPIGFSSSDIMAANTKDTSPATGSVTSRAGGVGKTTPLATPASAEVSRVSTQARKASHEREGEGGCGTQKTTPPVVAKKLSVIEKLPTVEGSANCPFCKEDVMRAKLSVHLLRCQSLRKARTVRTTPQLAKQRQPQQQNQHRHPHQQNQHQQQKAPTDGVILTQSAASSSSSCNANSRPNRHPSPHPRSLTDRGASKVHCPHCLRGFSPSVAPTHVAICAKVENRPKGAGITHSRSRSGNYASTATAGVPGPNTRTNLRVGVSGGSSKATVAVGSRGLPPAVGGKASTAAAMAPFY